MLDVQHTWSMVYIYKVLPNKWIKTTNIISIVILQLTVSL